MRRKKPKKSIKKKEVGFDVFKPILIFLKIKKKRGRPRKKPKKIKIKIKVNFDLLKFILKFLSFKKKRGRPKKISKSNPHNFLFFIFKNFIISFKFFKRYIAIILSLIISFLILLCAWWIWDFVLLDLPSVQDLTKVEPAVTTKIFDRNGKLLYSIYGDENRTIVPLENISFYLKNATIAIEDQNFYNHQGFSFRGIFRAFINNSKNEKVQGGSTITQQLVKNRLLSTEKTYKRKIREILLAILAEGIYSKEQIFEMYLNQVSYGGSTYGVEEAAWRYFNKSAKDLSLAESVLLAGLPQAPSVYSPFGPAPELAQARKEEVLRRMVEDGYISQEEATNASNEKLNFRQDLVDIKAPHFVMYVKKILAETYGEEMLTKGGLEVRTTLDLDLQNQAQEIVVKEVEKLKRLNVNNGASLVTNPRTGEILAMVGSVNYFNFANDGQVNVALRLRQPGSSIKPLTYAIALERGKTPSSIIVDQPIVFPTPNGKPYAPVNYDGKFHGNVTLRVALASSYNVPAVKTLNEIGVESMIDKAEKLGITTWGARERFGLSLTLGGGEVKMIEMAELYSSFANLGYPVTPQSILEVKNYKGEILYKNDCALYSDNCFKNQELDPRAAYLITDILSDNKARSPAFGANSVLNIKGQQVAVKTGTTNNLRDNWTIGYTTDRLVAVWVGNNDNQSMSYVASGITGASPIWNNTIRLTLDDERPHLFNVPAGFIKVKVCTTTGTLPCTGCPSVSEEVFVVGTEPTKACNPQYFANLAKEREEIKIQNSQKPAQPTASPRQENKRTLWGW